MKVDALRGSSHSEVRGCHSVYHQVCDVVGSDHAGLATADEEIGSEELVGLCVRDDGQVETHCVVMKYSRTRVGEAVLVDEVDFVGCAGR